MTFSMTQLAFGQNRLKRKADRSFRAEAYQEAIDNYESLLAKGDASHKVMRNLADSYLQIADYTKAAQWYAKIWEGSKDTLSAEYGYRYALCLKTLGNYAKSDSIMEWFSKKGEGNDSRAEKFLAQRDYRYWIAAKSDDFEVERLLQNSDAIDFAPALMGDALVFSSNRDIRVAKREICDHYRSHPLRLFSFDVQTENEPKPFSRHLGSRFNESSVAFSKNYDTLYITRNNNTGKRFKRGSRGFSRLKLYRSVRNGDSWGKLKELPFNSDDYSTAHPSLSADGKTLYFASDRPGGYGGTDIYFVALMPNGFISEPVNLGPEVNTEGNETFPHIGTDKVLFFASDGHPGLGGMDIFALDTKVSGNGCVINLGGTINSRFDDFGIAFNEDHTKGYLASDRNGRSKADIFGIKVNDPEAFIVKCGADVEIRTINAQNAHKEADVAISLFEGNSKLIFEGVTDSTGTVAVQQPMKKGWYLLKASKQGYANENRVITLEHDNDAASIEIEMGDKQAKKDALQVFEELDLRPILFAFDSAILTANGKKTLFEVARFMKAHKNVGLRIYGHADASGPEDYNLILSQKRADSALHFLTEQGVAKKRLKAVGMGESQAGRACKKDKCSPSQRRRVEYIAID